MIQPISQVILTRIQTRYRLSSRKCLLSSNQNRSHTHSNSLKCSEWQLWINTVSKRRKRTHTASLKNLTTVNQLLWMLKLSSLHQLQTTSKTSISLLLYLSLQMFSSGMDLPRHRLTRNHSRKSVPTTIRMEAQIARPPLLPRTTSTS